MINAAWVSLKVAEVRQTSNLDGTRPLSLAVPADCDVRAGQAVRLEVKEKQ